MATWCPPMTNLCLALGRGSTTLAQALVSLPLGAEGKEGSACTWHLALGS